MYENHICVFMYHRACACLNVISVLSQEMNRRREEEERRKREETTEWGLSLILWYAMPLLKFFGKVWAVGRQRQRPYTNG